VKTIFLLIAQYDSRSVIPVAEICQDYFTHLTPAKFIRKVTAGQIELPLVSMEDSQKSMHGVHLTDLAAYIDKRREQALRELNKISG